MEKPRRQRFKWNKNKELLKGFVYFITPIVKDDYSD